MPTLPLTPELTAEYQKLFDTCQVRPEKQAEVNALAAKIVQNAARYQAVGNPLSVPWQFIGVVHTMEASQRFDRHLHNGDPLTARTVQVPAGRPLTGNPPFTWEESATDALTLQGVNRVTDWTLPGILYQLEKYNGFGYRTRHPEVLTPYLWSATNHYSKGKYVADGKFDPDAVSKQDGAAVILQQVLQLAPISTAVPAT
jgi:lysozyme family protein